MTTESPTNSSALQRFWQELRRRKVVRVATVYVVTGWLIIQVAESTFGSFGIPDWAFRFVTLMVLLGLPVAVILAWAFELTPDGIKVSHPVEVDAASAGESNVLAKKRNWTAYAFGALLPTIIFGSLALFFYTQTDRSDAEINGVTVSESADESARITQSIAVLPLVNMSSLEENEYFAGGVHEDILTNLSRIDGLQVISRTSMLRYATSDKTLREIGEELGVDYIVEGSVRRIGNHVRVTIQLINADNDMHLWANNYERELVDSFATQSAIAREITRSIHLEIQPEWVGALQGMPTTSVKAYDLYIKADSIEKTEGETEESMIRRRDMLEEAVAEDPDFVEAWAVLNRVYDLQLDRLRRMDWYLGDGGNKDTMAAEIRANAKRALDKAVALDPDNPETLLARAVDHVRTKTAEERQQQKALYDQIIAAHPEFAKVWYHLGFWYSHGEDLPEYEREDVAPDAAAAFEEALRLDPFNARMVAAVLTWYRDRGYEEEVAHLSERLNQIIPESAADRRLARVSWNFRRNQLISAFEATADESLIEDYRLGWLEAVENGDYSGSSSILQHWHEARLSVYLGDMDRLIELSRLPFDLNESAQDPVFFSLFKLAAVQIHVDRGELDQARQVAESILQQQELLLARPEYECTCYLGALVAANAVLGNSAEAQRFAEELVAGTGWSPTQRRRMLGNLDAGRAAEMAFAELERNPSWTGFDDLAADYIWYTNILAHPKTQEHYVQQGKWIDYLAERVPAYSKFKRTVAE